MCTALHTAWALLALMHLLPDNARHCFSQFVDPDLVPTARLELARLSPPPPQDGVSTNSTTSANNFPPGDAIAVSSPAVKVYFGISFTFESSPAAGSGSTATGASGTGTSELTGRSLVDMTPTELDLSKVR